MPKNLYVKTYGCQMNFYDSSRIIDALKPLGYELVEEPVAADVVVLNTCAVREKATEKLYSDLGRLNLVKKQKQEDGQSMSIVVTGCVGQAEGGEVIRRAPYVDIVLGPQTYHRLPELIAQANRATDSRTSGPGRGIVDVEFPIEAKFDSLPANEHGVGVTAFLTIQEGCDKFCTFCLVPYTRGAEYSRPLEEILTEARHLVEKGVREITLLGQNVNAYHGIGPDSKEVGLGELIEHLSTLEGLARVRFMTSHPRDMDEKLIRSHGEIPQLMPYLHLPVQSGSNAILKAMNRRHTREDYFAIIDKIRAARPDIALSSDFIVGFPGETEEDFLETIDLVKRVEFSQAYSFKYSIRPGTPAGLQESQVPEEIKSARLATLQDLLLQQQHNFNQRSIGKITPVLFEKAGRHAGQLMGRTPHNQTIHVEAPERLVGCIVDVKITEAHPNTVHGVVVACD